MNSFQNCCLFFQFTKIWFFIIPLPCEEQQQQQQQQQQLPSSCFDQWDDRWRCPANQVRLRLTIWFKHIKHLTISIYQDVFVQIGTERTRKNDTERDWWKWNVYFGQQEFSYHFPDFHISLWNRFGNRSKFFLWYNLPLPSGHGQVVSTMLVNYDQHGARTVCLFHGWWQERSAKSCHQGVTSDVWFLPVP